MSGATNWAAAFGGFLGGGEDAYNKATILQRAKTQQDLENEQKAEAMKRLIVNDQRDATHQSRMESLQDAQNRSLDESRKYSEGLTALDRYGSGAATPEMLQSLPPALRALATQKLPDAGIMAEGLNGQPVDQSVQVFKPSNSERLQVAQMATQQRAANQQGQMQLGQQRIDLGQARLDASTQHAKDMLDVMQARQASQQGLNGVKATAALQKQFSGDTKEDREVIMNLKKIQAGMQMLQDPNNPNKTAAQKMILDGYEKIGNPGSIIRQGSLAQDIGHQGLWDQLSGAFQAAQTGGFKMTDPTMTQFSKLAGDVGKPYIKSYRGKRDQFTRLASSNANIDPDLVTGEDLTSGLTLGVDAAGNVVPVPAAAPIGGALKSQQPQSQTPGAVNFRYDPSKGLVVP